MQWTDKHTLSVGCALVGLLSALLVARPNLHSVTVRPAALTAAPPPVTAAEESAAPVSAEALTLPVTSGPQPAEPPVIPATLSETAATPLSKPAASRPKTGPAATATTAAAPAAAKPAAPATVVPATPAPSPPVEATSDPLARGRELTGLLYSGRLKEVWAAFTPGVRSEWKGFDDFAAYRAEGDRAYGAETRVYKEKVIRSGSVNYYTRTATFRRSRGAAWTVIFGLDPRGRVQEFGIVGAGVLPGDEQAPGQ